MHSALGRDTGRATLRLRSVSCVLALACLAAAACTAIAPEQLRTRRELTELRMGTPSQEVVARLGPPERRESYRVSPDVSVAFLFYRTGPSVRDAAGEDLGLTPVAVGKWGLESTARTHYHDISLRCPRIGHERATQ